MGDFILDGPTHSISPGTIRTASDINLQLVILLVEFVHLDLALAGAVSIGLFGALSTPI